MARSISQASTLQIKLQDGDRQILSHENADPFIGNDRWIYGIPNGFILVQFAKSGDEITLTSEDAVINKLRGYTGTKAMNPGGGLTFVDFARQLCAEAGVPIIADSAAAPLAQPVQRGGTNTPNEDTWACLGRMASDRGWHCFSDGTSIILGPSSWLLAWGGSPAMTLSEAAAPKSNTTVVDVINGSMDTGKPVSQISVTTRASEWAADPGAWVRIASGNGPLSGDWIVSDINRQNLASDQLAVSLMVPTPPKAEPPATSTSTTSATPPVENPTQRVVYGTVSTTVWNNLLQQGYTPQGGGGGTVLMVKPSDFRLANL